MTTVPPAVTNKSPLSAGIDDALAEAERLKKDAEEKIAALQRLKVETAQRQANISEAARYFNEKFGPYVDEGQFIEFFKEPYVVERRLSENALLVAVPKWAKWFSVGWQVGESNTYYRYRVDQFSKWFGDVPKDLLDIVDFKQDLEATVDGETLHFTPADREKVKAKLGDHLSEGTIGENSARIKRGHAFPIIDELVRGGCIPFRPQPVTPDDMRPARAKFQLRPYQKPAAEKFYGTGAVGVFYPTGAGKSFIAMDAIDQLKGPKVLFTYSRTLVEQWTYYFETYVPHALNEVEIFTYAGFRDTSASKEYVLGIFDECQFLPANTFSRLATLPIKYRMGLSASPHREDGRESFIFALTGWPVGINWREYMETVGRKYHKVRVHIVDTAARKLALVGKILDRSKKTIIFSDGIDLGAQIAEALKVPHVHGETNKRLDIIRQSRVVVASRVADMGVSDHGVERVIEVDFLKGSRMQELQRTGRLMHSDAGDLAHDIIFTEQEMHDYGKRLWGLTTQGFVLETVDHTSTAKKQQGAATA